MATGFLQIVTWRSAALLLCESLLIVGAIAVAARIRLGEDAWPMMVAEDLPLKALLIAAICQLCLYYQDLYDDSRAIRDRGEVIVRTLHALGAASVLLASIYYLFPGLVVGRGVFILSALLVIAGVLAWRIAFDWMTRAVGPSERLLMVGTGAAGVALARELHDRRDVGVEIVGFIDPDPAAVGRPLFNPAVIGTVEDIPSIVRARSVDRVVVSLSDARGRLPMDKLLEMKLERGVAFDYLASVYEQYTGKIAVENLRPSWFIFSSGFRKTRSLLAAKRVIDVVAVIVGLLLAAPLMLLAAVAVKATSRGPVLYHQQRVGHHGRVFAVHKLRSMREGAEAASGPVWASRQDGRTTVVGQVLRRTRLDEVPQLWNVLKGEMSLVGPRPERPEFVTRLTREIPFYGQRHVVKPGITGWAQVRYTYGASVEDAMEKLQYDLFYIKNLSVALDLFIMFETVKTVLLRRGAA